MRITCNMFDVTLERIENNTQTKLTCHKFTNIENFEFRSKNKDHLIDSYHHLELSYNTTFLLGTWDRHEPNKSVQKTEPFVAYEIRLNCFKEAARAHGWIVKKDPRPDWY